VRVADVLGVRRERYRDGLASLYEAAVEGAVTPGEFTAYMAHMIAEMIYTSTPLLSLKASNIIYSGLTQ